MQNDNAFIYLLCMLMLEKKRNVASLLPFDEGLHQLLKSGRRITGKLVLLSDLGFPAPTLFTGTPCP